jgi:hypothetical protein
MCPVFAQSSTVTPIHVAPGKVLTFYSQTRLAPSPENPFDALPKGTVLRVRLVDGIDSTTEADGAAFRGALDSPLLDSHNAVLADKNAQVRGLMVLLRSRAHPEGFRYELLLTGLGIGGKMQDLTATLNLSLADATPAAKLGHEVAPKADHARKATP